MSIPRILHHIWLGPRPVPERWVAAWRATHPEWEHRLWREDDLRSLRMHNRQPFQAMLARSCWHGASDIARIAILRQHGGVYVDIDSQPLRPLTDAPFMEGSFFAGYEPVTSQPGRIANGTIGSAPHHDILKTYDQLVAGMTDLSEPWDTTGGTGLTAAVLAHRRCCRPTILPSRVFYPTDAHGRPVPGREDPYVSHLWATTNRLYLPRTVILVPRRAGDERRDRTWEFVRTHWEPLGWPIHEGHHDDGPFNAAAARNAAARLADAACRQPWEVAVFVDADTVMFDHQPVREAVALAHKTGHMVRPYDRYWLTDEATADTLMATGERPTTARRLRVETHGGVNVVPRALFDAVGGYDEGFRGWGSEDTAFELACRLLGGLTRTRGEVFHLWHAITPDRNTSHPGFIANVARRRRYEQARRRPDMEWLLAHRDEPDAVPPASEDAAHFGLVVLSNGRPGLLLQTMDAIKRHVRPTPDVTLICDDSGQKGYFDWLRERWPEARYDVHRHLGHGPAMARAWQLAAQLPVEWVLWMEEDMVFQQDIDLRAVAGVIERSGVVQMVFKRQPHFPAEVEAGGMIERFPREAFTEVEDGDVWLEHSLFYSLNPHLVPRSFLRRNRWPPRQNSEHHFSRRLFFHGKARVGMWGAYADPPVVLHAGTERTGTGY